MISANTLSWVPPQECLDYWAEIRRKIRENPTIIKSQPTAHEQIAKLQEENRQLQEALARCKNGKISD